MIKRMIVMLFLCGLVLGGVFAWKMYGAKMMAQHMAAMSNPPQTVSTMKAVTSEWAEEMSAVGTIKAVKGADLAFEVSGIIDGISAESDTDVEEGTNLVQLASQEDRAELDSLEANLRLAEITLARDEKQRKVGAVSQATIDSDTATRDSLKAQTEQKRALLDKKTLSAPFAGRLGIRQVELGQYISPGQTVITLQQLNPLHLDFTLPQNALSRVAVGQKIWITTDAYPDKTFEGAITAIEPKIDEATRNFNVRATLENPDKILRPGLFAGVMLKFGAPKTYLTLPQTALTVNPYGTVIFVLREENGAKHAESVFVDVVLRRGDQAAITGNIKEGDEIVTAGQLKLHSGTPVIVNNKIEPLNNPDPKVAND